MTQLKPTTVFIPVSVDAEIPEKDGPIHTITPNEPQSLGQWFTKEKGFEVFPEGKNPTHWLKEQSGYFFSKEELVKALEDAHKSGEIAGYERCSQGGSTHPYREKYIKELLP